MTAKKKFAGVVVTTKAREAAAPGKFKPTEKIKDIAAAKNQRKFEPSREPPKNQEPLSERRLAKLVDELYQTREKRYAMNKQATALEDREKAIRAALIANLPRLRATGIAGSVARAQLESRRIVRIVDWVKFRKYIVKHDAWEFLKKSVNDKAVGERWDAKKAVDGAEPDTVNTISLTKVK